MKIRYPILEKHRLLLPVYYLRRFIDLITGKKNDKAIFELKTTINIDEEKNSEMTDLINTLGL